MKPIRFLILVMLLMSRIVSFAGDPPEFKTWKDMSEEEILEEYSFYKKSAIYHVMVQIGDLKYISESFDGFTYDWRSALTGGEGSTEVRSQFRGVFHLRWDDPDYRSFWNINGTRDTTIYDMEGLKRAQKIVYEDWKKQFQNIKKLDGRVTGEDVLNSGSSLHNSVVIKDNVKTSSGDDVILDYSYSNSLHYDESYYKETIDDLGVEIKKGDYVGIQVTPEKMLFWVINNINPNYDNAHTLFGTDVLYLTATCSAVDSSEFKA